MEDKIALYQAIQRLDERSRLVVTLRYGLDGEPPLTLSETAARLGLMGSRRKRLDTSQVSRIEWNALGNIHSYLVYDC